MSPSALAWGPPSLEALRPRPVVATSAVRLAVCRLRSVSSVCGARHRLGESGVGSQRGPGDGGKAPQGSTGCFCSAPSPSRTPPHPPRPLPLLIDPSGVQCGAHWLRRDRGPLSCRDRPVCWNRVCSEPPRAVSLVPTRPPCPACAVSAPGPFARSLLPSP